MTSSKVIYKIVFLLVLSFFEVAYSQSLPNLSTRIDNLTNKQMAAFVKKADSGGLSEAGALANGYLAIAYI